MLIRAWLSFVLWFNRKAKGLAIRLVQWTGKSREAVHPKHLLPETPEQHWYLAHIKPGMLVLDLGCGTGAHAERVVNHGAHVVGMDKDEAMLRMARRRIPRSLFVSADLERGLGGHRQWDAVLCLDVLEHLVHRDRLLQDIRRALRPGGILLLGVPNGDTSWKRRLRRYDLPSFSDPDHKREYTVRHGHCGAVLDQGRQERSGASTAWSWALLGVACLKVPGRLRAVQRWRQNRSTQQSPSRGMGDGEWSDTCRDICAPSLRQSALRKPGPHVLGGTDGEHGGLPQQGTAQVRRGTKGQDALSTRPPIRGRQSEDRQALDGNGPSVPGLPPSPEPALLDLREELARNGFAVVASYPTVCDTPWIGIIDVIGGVSLTAYRWLSEWRRNMAARYPEENAGFAVVCEPDP